MLSCHIVFGHSGLGHCGQFFPDIYSVQHCSKTTYLMLYLIDLTDFCNCILNLKTFSLLTCERALNALVLPSFSPPLDTDSAECMAVLAASSTPSLIFFPMSVRLTSSRPYGHISKTFSDKDREIRLVCGCGCSYMTLFILTFEAM